MKIKKTRSNNLKLDNLAIKRDLFQRIRTHFNHKKVVILIQFKNREWHSYVVIKVLLTKGLKMENYLFIFVIFNYSNKVILNCSFLK